ncbi:tyrosine-type recombinase/integrase [Azospirillum argentinense]
MLGADEVVRFLEAVPSLKCRPALATAYGAGLRVSEVITLKIADIDGSRMLIRIEQGKGGKDRYAVLSVHPAAAWGSKCVLEETTSFVCCTNELDFPVVSLRGIRRRKRRCTGVGAAAH